MPVDLHTHSVASDGTETPARLIELAASAGLTAIALTDHDTQAGLAEASDAARKRGVELIPGVELSLEHPGGGMHLIVLWLTPGNGPLQARLAELREGRSGRNARIISTLSEFGLEVSEAEVTAEAGGGSIGRPHIAAVMVAKGYVPDIKTAFDEWLGSGRPAHFERLRLNPEEAIDLARQSGAVPVLAHPHTLGIHSAREMASLLDRLVSAGLVGLEAIYGSYRRHEREGYADLARRFGLVPSGGSDFHGDYKPGLNVGSGFGDLSVPDSVLEELRGNSGRA